MELQATKEASQVTRDTSKDNENIAAESSVDAAATPAILPEAPSEALQPASAPKPNETGGRGFTHNAMLWCAALLLLAAVVVSIVLILRQESCKGHDKDLRKKRPHIVFILADDLGWGDLSYNGNPQIRTPNIDSLAWNSVRLTRLYHQPMCTPTRSAIMSGRHPIHTGLQHHIILNEEPRGLSLDLKLLPEWLNDLGYTSYIVGKWHLGFYKSEYLPTNRGFVSHVGSLGGAVDYYTHERRPHHSNDSGLDFRRNLSIARSDTGKYYADLITEETLSVIRHHPVEKPMFLYVAQYAPHYGTPEAVLQAPPRPVEGYEFIGNTNRTIYATMVTALDESMGKIFAALQEKGVLNDTILVFASDNGGAWSLWNGNAASPWPFRGEKNTLWEGGVHVPGFVWTPKPIWNGPGSEYARLFHCTDWLPTLYEMAGGDVSNLAGIDGYSHFGSLHKTTAAAPRSEVLINIDPIDGNAAMIQGRYKLIYGRFPRTSSDWLQVPGARESAANETELARQSCLNSEAYKVLMARGVNPKCGLGEYVYTAAVNCGERKSTIKPCNPDPGPCLYDIIADPCEYHDIASENPQVVQRMQERIEAYRKGAVNPTNMPGDPESFPSRHGGAWVSWKDNEQEEPAGRRA